jgi:hypothetical protein
MMLRRLHCTARRPLLTLYYKASNCSLCSEAIELLEQTPGDFDLELRDISKDPALKRRYQYEIPVLAYRDRTCVWLACFRRPTQTGGRIMRGKFDQHQLQSRIQAALSK